VLVFGNETLRCNVSTGMRAGRERDRNGRRNVGSDPPTGGEGPIAVDSPTPAFAWGDGGDSPKIEKEDRLGCGVCIPMRLKREV